MNSVTITAPTAGYLIISGHAFVNNQDASRDYVLVPYVDGATSNGLWGAEFRAAADGAGAAELFELSYTKPVAVTAGAHTVTQRLGPTTGTATFFHNNEELTVLFVPNGSITTTA